MKHIHPSRSKTLEFLINFIIFYQNSFPTYDKKCHQSQRRDQRCEISICRQPTNQNIISANIIKTTLIDTI